MTVNNQQQQRAKSCTEQIALEVQAMAGINPLASYKRNVLATRNEILDLLQQLVNSERLADVAYMALQERKDPANGEAMQLLVVLLDGLADVTAEELSRVRKGLYDPSFIQPDMDYQQSLLNLTAYKEELSR